MIFFGKRDNPYVGPRALTEGDLLHGRDEETSHLFDLIIADRIALIYSASGAGKTSLLQAGLTPRLRKDKFRVFTISMQAGSSEKVQPANRYAYAVIVSIDAALAEKERTPPEELATLTLPEYWNRLDEKLKRSEKDVNQLALIFDQFEEVLTLDETDDTAKLEFFRQAGQLLRNVRISAVFAIRDDSLLDLDERYARYIPGRLSIRFRLALLTREKAIDAIRNPAAERDVTFSAADKVANDLSRMTIQLPNGAIEYRPGPWVEPVQLQVVCRMLWEKPRKRPNAITEEDLGGILDVDSALAEYYANCIAIVTKKKLATEREVRQWISRTLITERGVRQRVLREPTTSARMANEVIDIFVENHVFRSEKLGTRAWFELSHDRLVEPIRNSNLAWTDKNLKPFQKAAVKWNSSGRKVRDLLRDQNLVIARRWANANAALITELDRTYLDQSMAALDEFQKAAIEWELNGRDAMKLLTRDQLERAEKSSFRPERLNDSERALLATSREARNWETRNRMLRYGLIGGSIVLIAVLFGGGTKYIVDTRDIRDRLTYQINNEKTQRGAVEKSARELALFYAPTAVDRHMITEVLEAQKRIAALSLATPVAVQVEEKQKVDYFAKPGDDPRLVGALKQLGFDVNIKPAETTLPTNCIWYGEGVPEKTVTLIALATIRAGVGLQSITPFVSQDGRESLVQIGSNPRVSDEPPITAEEIDQTTMGKLNRRGARRLLENAVGGVKEFDVEAREGTIETENEDTVFFRQPVDAPTVRAGQRIVCDVYQNDRRMYAVHVRPVGAQTDTAEPGSAPPVDGDQ